MYIAQRGKGYIHYTTHPRVYYTRQVGEFSVYNARGGKEYIVIYLMPERGWGGFQLYYMTCIYCILLIYKYMLYASHVV